MDIQTFFKLSYGLYVASSAFDGKQCGCIVNTVAQVTAEPPKIAMAVSKNNFTTSLIEKSGVFNAAVLAEKATMELIGRFGFQSGRDIDKFDGIDYKADQNGVFYPTEGIAAVFPCKVIDRLDLDTHVMFIGLVKDTIGLSKDPVMTYDYYHSIKKGETPPNAPSYKAPTGKKGWRCTICGYIHEDDELPDDFICPVCKRGADVFVKL